MSVDLDLQLAGEWPDLPSPEDFQRWADTALTVRDHAELTIRVVGRRESRELNGRFRGKDYATNVLSFPADVPEGIELPLLGDIVVCAPLVAEEAGRQGKSTHDHWAHLVIHGILHLQGYDHVADTDAEEMESLEIELLARLGIADPYR